MSETPIQLTVLHPTKAYYAFKDDRKWRWKFNREKYRRRQKA